jgi:hypothetical protein
LKEPAQEVFQGCPVIKDGYWYPNDDTEVRKKGTQSKMLKHIVCMI